MHRDRQKATWEFYILMVIPLFFLFLLFWGVSGASASRVPIQSLVNNPWFDDGNCGRFDGSGWTDLTPGSFSWGSSKKPSNPGPCDTAIRWHRVGGLPAGVKAVIQQEVPVVPGAVMFTYDYVSLGDGLGTYYLYTRADSGQDWELLHQSSWGGHDGTWHQAPVYELRVPAGHFQLLVKITGIYWVSGGVKTTGVTIWQPVGFRLAP